MKYLEATFHITPYSEAAADVLSALLADEGFEAFDASEDTLQAWVQMHLYSPDGIRRAVEAMPFPDMAIEYSVADAPDENWNRRWEEDGFKPIVIYADTADTSADNKALITIHDTAHPDVPDAVYDICISPCQAFGTGSHETTRMILRQLLAMPIRDRKVIDAGTGTGILAIFCRMLGAAVVLAYDIDEWSVRNARENLALNGISSGVQVLLGDSSVLARQYSDGRPDGQCPSYVFPPASLLIANINRNILLGDLPVFAESIEAGGELLLSGFYTDDVPMLLAEASRLGFTLSSRSQDHDWAMLLLKKEKHTAQ